MWLAVITVSLGEDESFKLAPHHSFPFDSPALLDKSTEA